MKALAMLLSALAACSLVAVFVLMYIGIFTHDETAGWAAYCTGFLTTPVLGGLAALAWMQVES